MSLQFIQQTSSAKSHSLLWRLYGCSRQNNGLKVFVKIRAAPPAHIELGIRQCCSTIAPTRSKINNKIHSFGRYFLQIKSHVIAPKILQNFMTLNSNNPLLWRFLPWIVAGSVVHLIYSEQILVHTLIKPVRHAHCNTACDVSVTSSTMALVYGGNHSSNFLRRLTLDYLPLALRAVQLICFFTPLLVSYPLTYLGPRWFDTWLWLLYVAVEHSGATFIKLGQWASTRRDLFSPQVCDRFSNLHFQVRPHTWRYTAHVLREAYGEEWQKILHLVDGQKPIGSGCIAQVYKGYLSSELIQSTINNETVQIEKESPISGKETDLVPVAIKVLHPSIEAKFKRDMILMAAAARSLTFLFPRLHWISLNQCVAEFKAVMEAQLDMHQESLCLQKFTEHFSSCSQVHVPKPFPNLVRHNILVETFEEGISVGAIVRDSDQPPQLKKELASIGVDAMLRMVFVNNFVHADLHPGNLLVQNVDQFKEQIEASGMELDRADEMMDGDDFHLMRRKSDTNGLRLVLLDCGITASLEPEDRQKFQEVFTAVVKGEGEVVADLFLSKSAVNHCTDPVLFRTEMAQLVRDARQNLVSISKIKVAELMNSVFSVLSRHKIQLEANFATIILAMAMLEGLGRSLNPDLDLLDRARPVLLGSYMPGGRAKA